jgi:DNA-binding transcriptional LysR family regulator
MFIDHERSGVPGQVVMEVVVDLVQLRAFVTVAEELHFGRAAERLHVVPSAVSQHVSRLERELGGRLFDRTSRRVELTAAGRTLLREARHVLDAVQQARDETGLVIRASRGSLSLASPSSARDGVALPALLAFEASSPGVVVDLLELPSREISRRVASGEVDAGFAWLPEVTETIVSRIVAERPLVVVLPDDHELRTKDEVGPGDLAGSRFVVGRRADNPHLHDLVAQAVDAGTPRQVDSLDTMAALVRAGHGVGVTVADLAGTPMQGVTAVPLAAPPVPLSLVWCRDNTNPALSRFLSA